MQIDYDPSQVTYAELLDVFWDSHRPDFRSSRQYRSAILYHNEQQRQQALASKTQQETALGTTLFTAIEPFRTFTLAEDYHQKFNLRQKSEIFQEYMTMYPEFEDFVNSTAVARMNGYVAGNGSAEQARAELDSLGLSDEGRKQTLKLIQRLR